MIHHAEFTGTNEHSTLFLFLKVQNKIFVLI